MAQLTILHLSDLHWSREKANDQKIIIDGLVDDIRQNETELGLKADLIIFSGDLVQAGEDAALFDEAKIEFLDRVLDATKLETNRLVMAPGNHDIMRQIVRDADFIDAGLQSTLTTVDKVNHFIDGLNKVGSRKDSALHRLENWAEFIKRASLQTHLTEISPLLSIGTLTINGITVGIASFNSAWRCSGEDGDRDRRRLLVGERNVDTAISSIKNCNVRIAVIHHPFEWLTEFDESAVSSRIYSHFDIVASGHIHKSLPEARVNPTGSAILSQSGCLYESRKYFNGYQYLKIDFENKECEFSIRSWFDAPRRSFDAASNLAKGGALTLPFVGRADENGNAISDALLREIRPIIREAAGNHINMAELGSELRLGAKEAFVCPPLSLKRRRHASEGGTDDIDASNATAAGQVKNISVTPEEILLSRHNHIFHGRRECGKSSLAHYLSVLSAEGVCDTQRIPIVIDYRILKGLNLYGIKKAISLYLPALKNAVDVEKLLGDGTFLFIIDNFLLPDKRSRDTFLAFLDANDKNRFVIFEDSGGHSLTSSDGGPDASQHFQIVEIGELSRRAIRELSKRWCAQIGSDDGPVFNAIMDQLNASNLPRTGYIVALLLWAAYQERRFERINEAVLLMNMADHLLGKADFSSALLNNFDPTSKEITLQQISVHLRDCGGFSTRDDCLIFLIGFFKQKGLKNNASDVLDQLVGCGILTSGDGNISFKYRCFQEYFFAGAMRASETLVNRVFSDNSFVQFNREIEILAGLRRENTSLISLVERAIIERSPPELRRFAHSDFLKIARAESALGISRKQISDIRRKKLTTDQIDDLMDEADKKLSRKRAGSGPLKETRVHNIESGKELATNDESDVKGLRPLEYLGAVSLMGRILRNSEFTDVEEKHRATQCYIDSIMRVYLIYVDVLDDVIKYASEEMPHGPVFDNDDERRIVRTIIIQSCLSGILAETCYQISTDKLSVVYESILTGEESNSFGRLLIANLLLDNLHSKWPEYWQRIIEEHKGSVIILNVLIDRVWTVLHSKALPAAERDRMASIADSIERAMGTSKHAKSRLFKSIRDTASETTRRLEG
ncbi:metallophosphoesterase [Bosea sp. Root381]|uniref:metallophosphoesterase n=1 Tax=Bosea sp. Root381 TaxID=1736524 RepID=UPI00138F3C84|nr:metallophosphoesterase [Bosea sp. Root381]